MKLFNRKQAGLSTGYRDILTEAGEQIGKAEKEANGYLKLVNKGKIPSDGLSEGLVRVAYTRARTAIGRVEAAATTPAEKGAYEKANERFMILSANVAVALDAAARNYLGIARSSIETGDDSRFNSQLRREEQTRIIEEGERRNDESMKKILSPEDYQKHLEQRSERRRAEAEQRRKSEEELELKVPGWKVDYERQQRRFDNSNPSYTDAETALAYASNVIDTAREAAKISGSSSVVMDIESEKGLIEEMRKELERKLNGE